MRDIWPSTEEVAEVCSCSQGAVSLAGFQEGGDCNHVKRTHHSLLTNTVNLLQQGLYNCSKHESALVLALGEIQVVLLATHALCFGTGGCKISAS